MAETIFAGEKIEELSLKHSLITLTSSYTIFSGFTKNLFMGDRPRNARDGKCQQKKPLNLGVYFHTNGD